MPLKFFSHPQTPLVPIPTQEDVQLKLKAIGEHSFDREKLAQILEAYQNQLPEDHESKKSLEKLRRSGSICVITGQQLGFMGGPFLLILKAITAIHFARRWNAIPILWLATEDHDVNEIDHTTLIDAQGNLKKYKLTFPKKKFVEDLQLNESHLQVIRQFSKDLNFPIEIEKIKVKVGDNYAITMAQYLAVLFRGTGLLFIEPRLIRPLAHSFFKNEIENREEIYQILKRSEEQGRVLNFPRGELNLFFKGENQERLRIKYRDKFFQIGNKEYKEQEILTLLDDHLEQFSPSAAARPLLQSAIFPTLAYIAGPTEVNYYQQLMEYHHFHQIVMPLIIPRISTTFLPPKASKLLNEEEIKPWEINMVKPKHISAQEGHYLKNLLNPHNKFQERILNWWQFESEIPKNLIESLLEEVPYPYPNHFYCAFTN